VLPRAEQAERCAAGLRAHWRTQCGYVAGGEVAERDGILVTATNLADETLSCAFLARPPRAPEAALDWCVGWFAERGLRPGVELRAGRHPAVERALRDRGFTVVVRRPAMALHPLVVPDEEPPPRVSVRAVATAADLDAYQAIQGAVFGMTPEVTAAFLPREGAETVGVQWFLASFDDVPCAVSGVSVSAYGAGIVGVGTLPAYRRRGLARAATIAALRGGGGADLAWLYPSATARPLYEGLGFAALDDAEVWVAPRPQGPQGMQNSSGLLPFTQTAGPSLTTGRSTGTKYGP
jgi:GNAT superfamily N-acetyltransferase